MKKLFVLAFITMLCVACSTEEETTLDEGTNLEVELENYKGIFTTTDGQNRGALDVTLSEDGLSASGSLTLATGEVIDIFTDQVTDLGNIKEMTFTSNDLSFTMTTGEEGETVDIGSVTFRGLESSILAGRSTERAPLSPIVGSYTCPMCPPPLDNTAIETFNLLVAAADMSGNSTIASQTTLSGTTYNGDATQSGCVVNGSQTTCNLNSGTTPGMMGTAFDPGGGPVTWNGTHTFDNGTNPANNCSTVSGTWTWASSTIGTVNGAFTSNSSGDCAPPLTQLLFEDFEDATLEYVLRDESPLSTIMGVINEDISDAGAEDHFGRGTLAQLDPDGSLNYSGFQDSRFFSASDTDGVPAYTNETDFVTINWFDIPTQGATNIIVSSLFAEGSPASWDGSGSRTRLQVEYSFDNMNWTPIFGIAAPSTSSGNFAPSLDTDNDGVGDSTPLSAAMVELSGSFSNAGGNSTVSIRFFMEHLTGTSEDIAFDNVTVTGN